MQPPHEHAATAVPTAPGATNHVVGAAVSLIEAAALTAAMRGVASWSPLAHLYAAADRAWGSPGGEPEGSWRTWPGDRGSDFRAAVLLAEAAASRFLADGAYLSARQLSLDLRHAADWLGAGAPFDG
jgi:hypothetical protein